MSLAVESEILHAVNLLTGTLDTPEGSAVSDEVQQTVTDAVAFVDKRLGRRFIAEADATTRTYDAPANQYLFIDDVLATPSVTAYSVALTVNTHYRLILNKAGSAYDRIQRVSAGLAIRWDAGAVLQPFAQIAVTGRHGYAATVPDEVKRLYVMVATRMWSQRTLHFSRDGGGADFGTLDSTTLWDWETEALGRPYRREKPAQVVAVLE